MNYLDEPTVCNIYDILKSEANIATEKDYLFDLLYYTFTKEVKFYAKDRRNLTRYLKRIEDLNKKILEKIPEFDIIFIAGPRGGKFSGYYKLISK